MKAKSLFITWITCTVILGLSMQQLIAFDKTWKLGDFELIE